MTKVLLKVNNKVMATDGKLLTQEKQEGTMLKTLLNNTKSASHLFSNYRGNNICDLISYNDTENVTDFSYMFKLCNQATTLPSINTCKGTNFSYLCDECNEIENALQIDTSKATNINYIYSRCYKLRNTFTINTDKVTKIGGAFESCYILPKIDITHYNISSTSSCFNMCGNCRTLKALIIRSFGANYVLNNNSFSNCYKMLGIQNATYNPNGEQGYVYVPRDMKPILEQETNWSTLQFRALEDYTDDGTTTGKFLDEKAGL